MQEVINEGSTGTDPLPDVDPDSIDLSQAYDGKNIFRKKQACADFIAPVKPIALGGGKLFTIGIGPSVLFPSNTSSSTKDNNWGLGLSILGLLKTDNMMALAMYNPNWGIGEDAADVTYIQAGLAYFFETGTTINCMPFIMKNDSLPGDQKWMLPIGVGVGQAFKLGGKLPMMASLGGYYNVVKPDYINADWQIQLSLVTFAPNPFCKDRFQKA